jgi:hypothetical protein
MFNRLKLFYGLFKQGQQVSNPEFWHKGQAVVQPVIAALIIALVALARSFGYELPIPDDLAFSIAGAIFFAVNSVLTIIASKHIGLPATTVREAEPPVRSNEQTAKEEPANVQIDDTSDVGRGKADSSIDDDVRARALEWARQHSATNGLSNDS